MRVTNTVKLCLSCLLKRGHHPPPSSWKGKAPLEDASAVQVNCFATVDCGAEQDSCCGAEKIDDDEADDFHSIISDSSTGSKSRLVRVVSVVRTRRRWTGEQERDLSIAEHELARCQKAWSSEQELWLAYIKDLEEEKEAHEDFLHHRSKQQDDERLRFRRAWERRRSDDGQSDPSPRRNSMSKLRRLRKGSDSS
ncbi:hypothetical protein ASPZODRAFT_144902 [Penicilliopsis zonata CBS 506.65]|uniref:Uncharacterized protein n=1 Tax=Penicilliopsis zonata CBS 506.65 TaxID=1073090 RepID=A0A1L9SB09_9EURO|nr:hypothetical protein ASPZODRAFT_144902 [Penicilliopsis zonata CBS 506.65]OJJ44326.1 hypothetical protein ASPZODRAFT_144902 [Penicilliopsis zonata CBS 506.65]